MGTREPSEQLTAKWAAAGLTVAVLLIGTIPLDAECNSPPFAVNDSARTVTESVLIDVLANDSDPEGQVLSVAVTGTTCPGTATVDFDLVVFTPQPRLTQDCTITYSLIDEGGLGDTGTISVELVTGIFSDGFESGDTSKWQVGT